MRNVELPGAEAFPNLESVRQRFLSTGFHKADALPLSEIRRDYITPDELERSVFYDFLISVILP